MIRLTFFVAIRQIVLNCSIIHRTTISKPILFQTNNIHTNSSLFKTTFDIRIPLAGGLAGAFSTAILFPIDTYKTMRQTDSKVVSWQSAIEQLKEKGFDKVYSGFIPSVLGSMISSAIYFGTYEWSKLQINNNFREILSRPMINALAAISGNIMSSFVFVPKDALKQQMQYMKISSTQQKQSIIQLIVSIFKSKGILGFYSSYKTTLIRNIPSAIVRFTLYEELKYYSTSFNSSSLIGVRRYDSTPIMYLVSGAVASSLSSGLTTPFDVIKTRIATGMIAPKTSVLSACRTIIKTEGYAALYRGIQARMIWSALFGGIGFYTFEKCKIILNVPDNFKRSITV
jgi:hypothetical protein